MPSLPDSTSPRETPASRDAGDPSGRDLERAAAAGRRPVRLLLTHEKFKTFTPKAICDATKSTEVLVGLSADSRAKVDEMVAQAVAAGGTTYNQPQDHGFMYGHGFQDLDGHIWELVYMESSAIRG